MFHVKQVQFQFVAVIGRGPRPGSRQTAAALASANELAGRQTQLSLSHAETARLVSRETRATSAVDVFGVVDEDTPGADEMLTGASRIVISLADTPDLAEFAGAIGNYVTGDLGVDPQRLIVVVHAPEMTTACVQRLSAVEVFGWGRHPFCISHLSDGYHEILKKGILNLGTLGTEPAIANLVEVWTELRL